MISTTLGRCILVFVALKRLPHNELLYWKRFNEAPKDGMSERAFHH